MIVENNAKNLILVAPKLGIGGIQRALTNLANWFVKQGYKVTLVSCKKEEVFYPLDQNVAVIVPEFEYTGKENIFINYGKVILFLRRTFKNSQAKNIISFGDVFNPLVLIAARGLNKQVHISDRTSPDYKFKWYVKYLKKITYPSSATFIAQTTRAKQWNERVFQNKLNIEVIPNPCRQFPVSAIQRKKIVLYVGRFAWEKAPERLIRAFAKIRDKQGFVLHMCGDGPLLAPMKALADSLGISDQITFWGQVKDVEKHYAEASVFVLPSVLEGFPNALCEAMSAGLATVCYDSIPYEDIGTEGEDFLVATLEPDGLAEAIQQLIHSDPLRDKIGYTALRIQQRLSMDAIGHQFEKIFYFK